MHFSLQRCQDSSRIAGSIWDSGKLANCCCSRQHDPDFAHRPAVKSVKSGYSSCPVTHARHYTDSRNLMRRLTVSEWVGTVSFLGLGVVLAACYRYGVASARWRGGSPLNPAGPNWENRDPRATGAIGTKWTGICETVLRPDSGLYDGPPGDSRSSEYSWKRCTSLGPAAVPLSVPGGSNKFGAAQTALGS